MAELAELCEVLVQACGSSVALGLELFEREVPKGRAIALFSFSRSCFLLVQLLRTSATTLPLSSCFGPVIGINTELAKTTGQVSVNLAETGSTALALSGPRAAMSSDCSSPSRAASSSRRPWRAQPVK